jgi:hypothetical protein
VRRASLLLAVLLLLPACGGAAPGGPPGTARILGGRVLELAQVRRAAVRFLQAYANSDANVEPLRRAVVGEDLEEWVRWLEVQARGVSLTGSLDVRRLHVLQLDDNQALVAVDAVVTFQVEGGGTAIRRFESPLMLARRGGLWAVFDATRDGRTMQETISVIQPAASGEDGGIAVQVRSLFRFTAGTSVNVRVTNRSDDPVSVSPRRSLLQVGGLTVPGRATSEDLQDPLAPGDSVEGILEFPQVPLDGMPELVGVALTGADVDGVVVPLPPDAFEPSP